MAEEGAPTPDEAAASGTTTTVVQRRHRFRWGRVLVGLVLGLLALVAIAVLVLNSSVGHRYVADRIASLAPASGLKIKIGRIDGSLYGTALLHDVTLSDPKGAFVRIPLVELDWRPFNWFRSGLDVRKLVSHRGTLYRLPELRPGDPNAPTLPNFDIRIDRLRIDQLTIAEGVLGPQRKVDFLAKADIRKGRAYLRAQGSVGNSDRLFALLDTQPDKDKYDLRLDLRAARGGLVATMTGLDKDLRVRANGNGGWSGWKGGLLVEQDGQWLAAVRLKNDKGTYGFLGQAYPDGLVTDLPKRALGEAVAIGGNGTFANSVLSGHLGVRGAAFRMLSGGTIDLANNTLRQVGATLDLTDPALFGDSLRLDGTRATVLLNGKFRDLSVRHSLIAERVTSGTMRAERVTATGTADYDGARWTLPLRIAAGRIVTGNAQIDPRLVNANANGTLVLAGTRLSGDNLMISVPGLATRLSLRGDLANGAFAVAGPVVARRVPLPNLGLADVNANIVARFGSVPWNLSAQVGGRMVRVDNATLTTLAGSNLRFAGNVRIGANQPLLFERATLTGSKLSLALSGRVLPDGRTTITGSGRQAQYGPFTIEASMGRDGPRAVLVFANPYPTARLRNVRVALSPIKDGFRIETEGGSSLGPFRGTLGLYMRPGGPIRVQIESLNVSNTSVTGALTLGNGAVSGDLALSGGGVNGTVRLAPRGGGQGFDVSLVANNARFGGGGATPLTISNGRLQASGVFASGHTTVNGTLEGQGIGYGTLFIGRISANATMRDGNGRVTATLSGRRGGRFNLRVVSDFAPNRITVLAGGDFAGRRITMPRRAVLTSERDGWRLAPTQIDFAGGRIIAQGLIGTQATALEIGLANMPLSVGDIFAADLGFGGTASGLITWNMPRGQVPTGNARLLIKGLSRSGLVLTSRPIDLALVADLGPRELQARAVVREGADVRGRLQARIGGLPAGGGLLDRLRAGSLFAQLRFNGPADALWRLAAIEVFDLTGPLSAAADVTGTIDNPQIRGTLASTGLRLQSALTGTDIRDVNVRGSFNGSRLDLPFVSGRASNGGTVTGSGSVDLSGLGSRGPKIDLKIAARNAQILNRNDMAAAVTGPIRIVSDGINGTIAGRLSIEKAEWRLGQASGVEQLPNIKTREINRPADVAPPRARTAPWRYLIDAVAENRIMVRGMGLDSEWGANVRLRGTTDAPAIGGQADFVRGGYEFAGTRFELTRGRINFDGGSPPNPRLDIAATASVNDITAIVTVTGTALRPEINFTSNPALPEEELLSRLLFGSSITSISAPEALQLGAALASLRGGGGLDPINKLRAAVGLDRLRIVPADPARGRGTGIAAGKYLGRRFYVEIVTDAGGYSATQLEFRVTSWLSILAAISTAGHESLNAKVQKDY